MLSPALSIARTLQKLIDKPLIGVRSFVIHEPIHLLWSWRESMKIKVNAARQFIAVSHRCLRHAFGFQLREDKRINRIQNLGLLAFNLRRLGMFDGLKCPPRAFFRAELTRLFDRTGGLIHWPWRTEFDPLLEVGYLSGVEFVIRWHLKVRVFIGHSLDQ